MEEKTFVDRRDELSVLASTFTRRGAELVVLYGRRRVGKSRLLKEACRKHSADVFVVLEEADYSSNLRKVADAVVKRFNYPSFSPASFKELFNALPDGAVVVLDEYSYLSNAAGEFQTIWEETVKPKKIKLFLCGSLIRVMEDLNCSLSSPLYGRATQIVKLAPLSLEHVVEWYGASAGAENVFNTYFCVGGVPRYLEVIEKPTQACVEEAFFSRNGLLLREGKLLLKESFPTSLVLPKILFAVSQGVSEATKIANAAQIKAGEASKYLSLLSDYGFVEKKYPVLGGTKKDVRFYAADKFLSFWTRFVWPRYNDIESASGQQALEYYRKNFAAYAGREFENAVVEVLRGLPRLVPFPFAIVGKQWGKAEEGQYDIDVCAFNDEIRQVLFGECKWQDDVDARKILADLKTKANQVDWHAGNRKEYYAVFAKTFKKKVCEENAFCVDLKDLTRTLGGARQEIK